MNNKIQAVITIVKVAQDHVAEIKAHPVEDPTAALLIDDVELGLGWIRRKLETLSTIDISRPNP